MRLLIPFLLLALTTSSHAQDSPSPSPYAGMQDRGIKALSAADIEGLLAGAGMGYAMAAELNGFPGPKHVLELADELALTEEQREATESLFALMQDEAKGFGQQLIELEAELDEAFASGSADAAAVNDITRRIGIMEGTLRAVHLRAHLQMMPILTMHQRHQYQELRGYGEGGMDHGAGGHDH